MRVPGLKAFVRSTRWLGSRFVNSNKALILLYHRVNDCSWDPYSLTVTQQHFAEQLEVLRQFTQPMTLQELVRALGNGKVPRRAVAITFDDGYADNLYYAKPPLERYEIPATVFVATGYMGGEFWWDELYRILVLSKNLPTRLSLTVHGNTFSWIVGNSANSTAEGIIAKQRKNVVLSVYRLLLSLCDEKRQEAIKQLRAWSGVEKGPPLQRVLSADEIVRLAQGGLVEVGAHTVTHPFLAKLPGSTQRREVQESKGYLEEVLGQPVRSFSYPNGSFSRETLGIVRDSGYACACDSIVNIVWRRSNCFQLPRFWVNDWDGDTFSRHLKRWLGG